MREFRLVSSGGGGGYPLLSQLPMIQTEALEPWTMRKRQDGIDALEKTPSTKNQTALMPLRHPVASILDVF